MRATRVRDAMAWSVLALCGMLVALRLGGLQVVYTQSVPVGVYWRSSLDERPFRRGELVCLEGWRVSAPALFRPTVQAAGLPQDWLEDEQLVKQVVAIEGDRVRYAPDAEGGHVEINGQPLRRSTRLKRAGNDVPLPEPPYPFKLGHDEVWLASQHERGFDSRYYGPVQRTALGCSTRLWWRW